MTNKSFWIHLPLGPVTSRFWRRVLLFLAACFLAVTPLCRARSEAPPWMHALVGVPLPAHDEKDNAILLYRNENLTVISADKFRTTVQVVYKILRPEGRELGFVEIPFDSANTKVTSIHAWCIPANGKDYEVADKDVIERSFLKDESDSLVTSEREKMLLIPAPDPGNIIGFEYVEDWHPYILQDQWGIQGTIPIRESHYSLSLPAGWKFTDAWVNHPSLEPHDAGDGLWQWTIGDVGKISIERRMPPPDGIAGQMVLTLFPPGGAATNTLPTWKEVGAWENRLTEGRTDPSVEIRQEVKALTAGAPTPLDKMRALAEFMQKDIRYVAITLGIGGWQPHPAAQVFANRFGDCKDKATLIRSMLREIGVESYYVAVNVYRGAVTPSTPANEFAFNHVIVAIKLPEGLTDPSLVATIKHPQLGTLLFFDPTIGKYPFGQIGGYLQANYGLLVTPAGGELVRMPEQPSHMNGVKRSAKLTLTASGDLQGEVEEVRVGDIASDGRELYSSMKKESDKIKPVELLLGDSLSMFHITQASVSNMQDRTRPFVWNYSFWAEKYAKYAGNLVLVRPRVLGKDGSGVLETTEPRHYAIEFEGPEQDIDDFEITLPPHYVVDDLPPNVDADFGFASYHSKTEVAGNVLRYHRTYEVKQLSVPVEQAAQLKKFYRIIASDERNTAVLKLAQ